MLKTLRQCWRTIVVPRRLIAVQAALDDLVDRAAARMRRQRTCGCDALRASADGGNARMITCERSCTHRSSLPTSGLALRRRQRCSRSSSEVGTPVYIYSARAIRDAYRAIDARVRRLPARDPLRAEGELDARDRAAAAIARQPRRRQLRRRDPGRAARRLRAGATSSSPASARRATSSSTRSPPASARSTPSRRASSIASPRSRARSRPRGARRAARQPGHRRAEPSEHLHRARRPTSSASPLQDARAIYRERRGVAGPALRRRPRPHRLADHDAPSRCAAPPTALATLALELRGRRRSRSSTWTSAAASASPTRDGRSSAPAEYAAAVLPELRRSGLPVVLEPGRADRRPRRRAGGARRRHQAAIPTAAGSPCSTPA